MSSVEKNKNNLKRKIVRKIKSNENEVAHKHNSTQKINHNVVDMSQNQLKNIVLANITLRSDLEKKQIIKNEKAKISKELDLFENGLNKELRINNKVFGYPRIKLNIFASQRGNH